LSLTAPDAPGTQAASHTLRGALRRALSELGRLQFETLNQSA